MRKLFLVLIILLSFSFVKGLEGAIFAQVQHPVFPQTQINQQAAKAYKNAGNKTVLNKSTAPPNSSPHSILPALKKMQELKAGRIQCPSQVNWAQSHDTILVGVVPHDT